MDREAKPRQLVTDDLQASPPEVRIGLSRAGVTGVNKAIRIRHGETEKLIAADIECTVDLDPGPEGRAHVALPRALRGGDRGGGHRRGLPRRGARRAHRAEIVGRQQALRAEVEIVARYPLERTTPVTGLRTQEMVALIGIAAASSAGGARRIVGVEATGINACPCAQGLIKGRAAERLADAGFASDDVERILELVPLATHNQRGRGKLYVGTEGRSTPRSWCASSSGR